MKHTEERVAHAKYVTKLEGIFADPRWSDLFGDDRFLLIDVGARGGLQKEWMKAAPLLRVVAIEPRGDERMNAAEQGMSILNVALDSEAGTRKLYLAGAMSSFLPPDVKAWEQFGFSDRLPLKTTRVKTTTLDAVVSEQKLRFVDFIKLDTQGTELDILRGGPVTVGEVAVGLRIEVLFVPLYESQPLFADVDVHVRSQGFNLVNLLHFRRYASLHTGEADASALKASLGQLVVADTVYFRTPSRVVEYLQMLGAPDRIRYLAGALVACMTYSQLDLAANYIHEARSLIKASSRALMLDLLRAHSPAAA